MSPPGVRYAALVAARLPLQRMYAHAYSRCADILYAMSAQGGSGGTIPAAMHAWRAFLRAHADLVGQMDTTLRAKVGIPLQWYDVLTHIDEACEPPTLRQLEQRVVLSQSGLSRLVANLVDCGLVSRSPSDRDKRAVDLTLTQLGKTRLRAARAVQSRQVRELFADQMDDREAAILRDVLRRLRRDRQE
jgi:DNA-binding MarR family transcriptional regulator